MRSEPISAWEPNRILLLGDAHGNDRFVEYAAAAAARNKCDLILQLGDFGYWEHTLAGREYLDRVNAAVRECGLPLLFIDGNHENHEMLRALQDRKNGRCDGLVTVREHVAWISRGTRWTWKNRTFAAVGGAASVDRSMRTAGWTWWPEEVLCREDVAHLIGEDINVIICHDAPRIAGMVGKNSFPPEDIAKAEASRKILDTVIDSCRPELVVHGHWHVRHSIVVGDCRIEGLADDESRFTKAACILDLTDLSVSEADEPTLVY